MEQINSSEEPAVNVDQEHQKPQSWLAIPRTGIL